MSFVSAEQFWHISFLYVVLYELPIVSVSQIALRLAKAISLSKDTTRVSISKLDLLTMYMYKRVCRANSVL